MDQEMANDNEGTEWPALSADVKLARATARTITLDTQRASEDGKILEVSSQLELVRTRLSSLERHVFDATTASAVPDDLLDRLSAFDSELAETASQFQGLAGRVAATEEQVATAMLSAGEGIDERLNVVEDARLAQTNELNELTGYLEQAFTRIAELASVIDDERGTNANARAENFNQINGLGSQVDTKVEHLDAALSALSSRVDLVTESIDASNASVATALEASVADLESRMGAAEARLSATDEVATSIQFLTARAEALEEAQINTSGNIIENVDRAHSRIDEAVATTSTAHERVDATERRITTAESQLSELLDHAATSTPDSASSAEVESIKDDVENVKNVIDAQAEITTTNSEKIESFNGTIESIEESAANQKSVLETHSQILDATTGLLAEHSGLLAESQESLASYHGQMEAHEATVARAIELAEEANRAAHEATEKVDSSDTPDEDLTSRLDSNSEQINSIEETVSGLGEQVTNAATAIDAAHSRIDETESAVFGATSQIDSYRTDTDAKITDVAHELHTRIDDVFGKVDRLEENETGQPDPELIERFEGLETQIAEVHEHANAKDGRIGEAHERITAVDGRIGEAHNRINTVEDRLDDAHERISSGAQQAYNTIESVDAVSGRVDETNELLGSLEQQVTALETAVDQALAETDDSSGAEAIASLSDQVADVRDATSSSTQRIDGVQAQVADLGASTSELRQQIVVLADQVSEQEQTASIDPQELAEINARLESTDSEVASLSENISTVTTQIDEVTAHLDQVTHQNSEENESFRQSMFSRFEDTEGRLTAIESNDTTQNAAIGDDRIEALEASVTKAEESAREAQSFSENLRLLQTDLVQAIQSEMRTQSDEIDQHTAILSELQSGAGGDHASAERVQVLEAKIGEALQSISQLTQLQRRNTTVETQLTDTLVATSQGVEHTQQHVIALRGELETALGRIARLESIIASLQAAPAAAVAPVEAAPQPVTAAPASNEDDDGTDTGWFTESYARKNAG